MRCLRLFAVAVLCAALAFSAAVCGGTRTSVDKVPSTTPSNLTKTTTDSDDPPTFTWDTGAEQSPPIDSDGDGMSDWFEEHIAGYDPVVPNNRYVILFCCYGGPDYAAQFVQGGEFLSEEAGIPSQNIFVLTQEEATKNNLQKAIEEIAIRANENDLVFIELMTHGSLGRCGYGITTWGGALPFVTIDEWVDKIKAKAVVISETSCSADYAPPVLKDGPCPRIVLIWYPNYIVRALGMVPNIWAEVDGKYGDGDGFVSLAEICNYSSHDSSDPAEIALDSDYPRTVDQSNMAATIYLTDYTIK